MPSQWNTNPANLATVALLLSCTQSNQTCLNSQSNVEPLLVNQPPKHPVVTTDYFSYIEAYS